MEKFNVEFVKRQQIAGTTEKLCFRGLSHYKNRAEKKIVTCINMTQLFL